jgi:hypothetical protein
MRVELNCSSSVSELSPARVKNQEASLRYSKGNKIQLMLRDACLLEMFDRRDVSSYIFGTLPCIAYRGFSKD